MKPVIDTFVPFTPDRVHKIRLNRELTLREGLVKHTKVKRAKTAATTTKKRSVLARPVVLNAKAQAALEAMDPVMRAMFEQAMKSL